MLWDTHCTIHPKYFFNTSFMGLNFSNVTSSLRLMDYETKQLAKGHRPGGSNCKLKVRHCTFLLYNIHLSRDYHAHFCLIRLYPKLTRELAIV